MAILLNLVDSFALFLIRHCGLFIRCDANSRLTTPVLIIHVLANVPLRRVLPMIGDFLLCQCFSYRLAAPLVSSQRFQCHG